MERYRNLALEAVITLEVMVDAIYGDRAVRFKERADYLAHRFAALDDEMDGGDGANQAGGPWKDGLIAIFGGKAPAGEAQIALSHDWGEAAVQDACEPADGSAQQEDEADDGADPDGDDGLGTAIQRDENVTVVPAIVRKPLPNEHPLNLDGSGRSGKPQIRFKMRKIGSDVWFTGTAAECAGFFGCKPAQVYKWGNGMGSKLFEVVKQ